MNDSNCLVTLRGKKGVGLPSHAAGNRSALRICSLTLILLAAGCTSLHRSQEVADITNENLSRIKNIRSNKTLFSDSISCFGRTYLSSAPDFAVNYFTSSKVAVSPIKDKTGNIYPPDSTAISDMVVHALSLSGLVGVLDNEDDINRSYTNYVLAGSSPIVQSIIGTVPYYLNSIPRGLLLNPNFHFSGALVEFNERENVNIGGTISFFSANYSASIFDVALDIRIISSSDGQVGLASTREGGEVPLSISVANRIVAINNGVDYFRIIGNTPYTFNYGFEIGDPRYYAVRELVEYSVLELLSAFTATDWRESCDVDPSTMDNVFALKDIQL